MQENLCIVQYILAFGLLESVFRVIVNRSMVYPPLAGLPAVFVADWRACPPLFWRAGLLAIS